MAFKGAGKAGGTGGKYDQEDRSRDWYCEKCAERNFMRRGECFKCNAPKPKDGGSKPPELPSTGTTLNGMVKSYNRKGFGFIMCMNGSPHCQDIYYSRENLHISLQTRDIPGEHVTFEIQRFPDGKLVAKNVRPHGETASIFRAGSSSHPAPAASKGTARGTGRPDEEDRSRDWVCEKCGERNFVKRFECFKCKTVRKASALDITAVGPRRSFSPHAGSRSVRDALLASRAAGGRSRSRGKGARSSSSSSSGSKTKKKKKGKKSKKKRSSSSSSSKSSKSSKSSAKEDGDKGDKEEQAEATNPEVEKAKFEIIQKLQSLQKVADKADRMKQYRDLLRQWHPDKNPDKVEVATLIFQFLQKAKPMIDPK